MATMAETDYQMPIGGDWGESDGGRFEVTNPATGAVVGTVVNATASSMRLPLSRNSRNSLITIHLRGCGTALRRRPYALRTQRCTGHSRERA